MLDGTHGPRISIAVQKSVIHLPKIAPSLLIPQMEIATIVTIFALYNSGK